MCSGKSYTVPLAEPGDTFTSSVVDRKKLRIISTWNKKCWGDALGPKVPSLNRPQLFPLI